MCILDQYNVELCIRKLYSVLILCGGPGSSVDIATDYGLDGPGSNPGGARFSVAQTGRVAHPASCTVGTGSFRGG